MIWEQIALFVFTAVLSYQLRPKPMKPPPPPSADLSEFDIPTAEAGRPVPVLFGRRIIASPNVVWFGHLKTIAIRESTGGGGKK